MMTTPPPTHNNNNHNNNSNSSKTSALSHFLGEILNKSFRTAGNSFTSFEIQNDNARLLAAGACCTKRGRRQQRQHHHHHNSEFENYNTNGFSCILAAPVPDENKASARWETHITSSTRSDHHHNHQNNDFMVTAPLRRKVYCEPEKIIMTSSGGTYQPPMRSAQIPLQQFGRFAPPTTTLPPPPPSTATTTTTTTTTTTGRTTNEDEDLLSVSASATSQLDCKPSSSAEQQLTTSDLLDEALDLLSEGGGGD